MSVSYAIAVVGRDRPGIVAAITEPLAAEKLNIADSEMAILRGHFTMMLVVSSDDAIDIGPLAARLDTVRESLDLESVSVFELDPVANAEYPQATHSVTVYGADHPGIVQAVTSELARQEINIVDLSTRVVGSEEVPIYVMVIDLAPPSGLGTQEIEETLRPVGSGERVDISVREIEREAL